MTEQEFNTLVERITDTYIFLDGSISFESAEKTEQFIEELFELINRYGGQ